LLLLLFVSGTFVDTQTFAPRRNEEEQVGETMRDIFCDFGEIFDVSRFRTTF
jgi:hypothetical protein